ncbi:MAG: hypothetical protein FJ352_00020 [Firmicutes bacterium]|nr:hypothetical protein [Bacillota bacterium]
MDPKLHPLESNEAMMLMHRFLADVIFEYRENEIKDWLQGLNNASIQEILDKAGNEDLKKNAFIIPFTYLHYAVVPNPSLVDQLKVWLQAHPLIPQNNIILQKTKLNFDRIFKGKTAFIHDVNNDGHKSY